MKQILAFLLATLWLTGANAQQGVAVGPVAPCSSFGVITGTCLQGAGAIIGSTIAATTSFSAPTGVTGGYFVKSSGGTNDGSLYEDASNNMTLRMSSSSGTNTYKLTNSIDITVFDYGITHAGAHTFTSGAVYFPAIVSTATTSAVCVNISNGLISYDGTIGTCTISDERLKNMGERIPSALSRLLQINGVYYTWKDKTRGEGRQIGVGAQTVEKVFPELVQTDSTGTKSADYARLTAPIIEALRELKADNDNLHAQIARLRKSK